MFVVTAGIHETHFFIKMVGIMSRVDINATQSDFIGEPDRSLHHLRYQIFAHAALLFIDIDSQASQMQYWDRHRCLFFKWSFIGLNGGDGNRVIPDYLPGPAETANVGLAPVTPIEVSSPVFQKIVQLGRITTETGDVMLGFTVEFS